MAIVTLPFGKRATPEIPARDARINIVAFLFLSVPIGIGIWGTVATGSPWPCLVGIVIGFTLMQ